MSFSLKVLRKITTGVKIDSIFSFQNNILVGNHECNGLTVYDMNSKELHTLSGHMYAADKMMKFRENSMFLSTGYQKIIGWKNYKKDKVLTGLLDFSMCICNLNDNNFITSDQNGNVIMWDYDEGKKVKTWKLERYFSMLKVDEENLLLSTFGRVELFNISTGKVRKTYKGPSSDATNACLVGNDGKNFAAAAAKHLSIWNLDGQVLREFTLCESIWGMISSGDYIVCSEDKGSVEVFHQTKGKLVEHKGLSEHSLYMLEWRDKERFEFITSTTDEEQPIHVCTVPRITEKRKSRKSAQLDLKERAQFFFVEEENEAGFNVFRIGFSDDDSSTSVVLPQLFFHL